MCKFPNFLCFVISSVSHSGQVPYSFTFHYIFSVPLCASSPYFYISFYIQCPILCKFPNFLCFVISSVSHSGQVPNNFVLHYSFPLYIQCPIMCKFPIFLPFIISSVSHYVQVLHLFTFHYIFSVPFSSSLSIYISLYLSCPIWASYIPIFLHYHYSIIFSVPLCASSPSFYIPLYLQCPILGKFYLHSISSVSHLGKYCKFPLCASLSIYISLDLQCPIMCKFSIFFHFIISLVSHFGQVPYLFTFHQIFSVPFWASSLSIYISLYLQCPILGKFPIYLHFIISSVSHYVQVLFTIIFTFHVSLYLSVPFCASSLTSYVSLYLQCPILGKYPIILCFIIYLVSHYVQVPYLFTFHYFLCVPYVQVLLLFTFHYMFSVPLCASSPSFYIPLYLQCPILGKFPIYLHFIISFSVPFGASSLSIYIPLDLQCPIWGKFPIYLHSIRSSVSHYVQVLHLFAFHYIFSVPFWASSVPQIPHNFVLHYIFSVPLCASSISIYISLYLQCTIMCKFSIFFHFIISLVSHFGQVPYLFTFHQIFSVPFWASSLSIYISLYLQCPILCKFPIYLHFIISSVSIMCKFPIFLRFIISLVSHYGQVPYSFTFHYIFSVPLCASSPYFYISFYIQCPILCKFPNFLCFVISSVSHSGQVPNNFVLHYIFSVPLCASSLSFYPLFLCYHCASSPSFYFIICSVSHYVQVLHLFTFHYIFSVPFWASSLSIYISLYLSVSHLGQVPYLFTFHQIFSVPFGASSLSIYIPLSSVSHYVQVLHLFTFHYIFSVPFWASSLSIYIPLDLQCPILSLSFISLVSYWASSLSIYISLYLQCPIMCKFPIFLHFIISLVSHYGQVPYSFTFHYIFSVPLCASSLLFTFHYIFSFPFLCASFLLIFHILVSHSGKVPYSSTFHICSAPLWASTQ